MRRNSVVTFFPPLTIGLLGGGQLGRMLALAAAKLGLRVHVFAPEADSPAFEVVPAHTVGGYDDEAALTRFAQQVDVITYEFENVPAAAAAFLATLKPVRPGIAALDVAQDRLSEKRFLNGLGIATAPFHAVETLGEIEAGLAETGVPAILKTRRLGYDGKGQVKIAALDEAAAAFAAMGGQPAILEGFVPFCREISVLVGRGLDGAIEVYDIPENVHREHILRTSSVPARIGSETARAAAALGSQIAVALDYVGVLAVELFVVAGVAGESLVANEIAPRVHNSGHWTESVCDVSQFEMHVRAVAGLALGSARRHADVVMENLIGDDVGRVAALMSDPSARVHLYGKRVVRAGRKMGHVNHIRHTMAE
ncbi:MAG: 5-(carboxyamino)imidazole ribonucleotide synthase [Ancalomicrobiaceae bacterium]|nr:5-(carboxyamino)imidazole ribonucleotide synthase [Ancalomicrobiaceae bacterium]